MSALATLGLRFVAQCAQTFAPPAVALAAWQRLRARRPDDPGAAAAIGHLLAGRGDFAGALPWLEQAAEREPGRAAHWFNLGFARQALARHEAALHDFDRAIACDAQLDRAHYGRALSLIKLGRDEAAVDSLVRNTELQPMSPYGWYQLAHVHHRQGRLPLARAIVRRLAGFEPSVARQLARELGFEAPA